jgi:hypothetical protein
MRSIVTFFLLGLAGYIAYQYVNSPVVVAPPQPRAKVSPSPEPPVEVESGAPDLSRVVVKDGPPLTHARVREVRASGILFIADQGMFKVAFDRLSPEFGAYYGPMAVADPVPTETPTPPADPASAQPTPKPRQQRNAQEDAQAELVYVQRKASLEDRMKGDQATIDRWYKQSSFNNDSPITQSQYDVAQADLNAAAVQLAQLEAEGP